MSHRDDEMARPILHDQDDNELDESTTAGCCGSRSACCNPSSSLHRFIALIFMCLLGFGSYFCYDNPGALQDNFKKDLDLSTKQFVMLYSIYSWPNVVLCFAGGFLIDRVFGIRMGAIIYMFILMIGQLIFATGALMDAFWMMILGRFVFGIGAESLAVAQNSYAVLWFKGKELNMVFGLQLSFARVGSTVNFIVMEPLYKYMSRFYQGHECTGAVLMLATLTCVMSFICALALGWMDKRAERMLRRGGAAAGADGQTAEPVARLSDVCTFRVTFWMVSVVCVAYYVAIFPFIALGKVFFMRKFDFSPEDANAVNSIVYIISAVASPLFGYVIDRYGRNVTFVFVSVAATIAAHAMLAFTFVNPYWGMALMGLAYSMLASSLWPLVALIIPEYQLGTAYGICQSVQNLGLAVISMVAGLIVDTDGYFMLELFFIGWLCVALLATVVIWLYDTNNRGNLNLSPLERELYTTEVSNKVTDQLAASGSVEDIQPDAVHAGLSTPALRNRYLNRVGVDAAGGGAGTGDSADDCEPLLDA